GVAGARRAAGRTRRRTGARRRSQRVPAGGLALRHLRRTHLRDDRHARRAPERAGRNRRGRRRLMHEFAPMSPTAWWIITVVKILVVFVVILITVAMLTLLERKIAGWIQDRMGPNRVGPTGLLQPIADGIKNILKEETWPAQANKVFFLLAPMNAIMPAAITFAVVPFAAPLPTPWGVVDMIVTDLPIGILYILALTGLGVYGIVMAGWSSNSKYSLLGGLRASAQMVSYEVSLGLSLIPVFILAGNVTLTQVVWDQQAGLGLWYALPLGLSFFMFVIASFAETNRLPFDMAEAESELVTGYHTE